MKQYPPLYSKDSKGNVRVWYMCQDDNKFHTVSGLIDGEKITTKQTVCDGKNLGKANETSPSDQAEKEILAKYKKQTELGYFESIRDIDKELYFSPMLAHKWEDYAEEVDWSKGVYLSGKLDGLRCVIHSKGMFSRNGKPIVAAPHIFESVKHIFDVYPNLVLDSELYCDRLSHDFNKIISLAKKTKPTTEDLEESKRYLECHIFDHPSAGGSFKDRIKQIGVILPKIGSNYLKYINHKLVYSEAEVEQGLADYLAGGMEGVMVNLPDAPYENKRSRGILKYKKFQDCEAEIMDIIPGQGNRSGMFGYAKLKLDNGKTFDSNARGNEELYRKVLENKKDYVGKRATVRFQNLTPDGVPRFPVIIDFDRFDV